MNTLLEKHTSKSLESGIGFWGATPSGLTGHGSIGVRQQGGDWIVLRSQEQRNTCTVWQATLGLGSGALPVYVICVVDLEGHLSLFGKLYRGHTLIAPYQYRVNELAERMGCGSVPPALHRAALSAAAAPSHARTPAISVSERLRRIQEYLSLTPTHIAEILGVSRPRIYAWLDGGAQPRDREVWERLVRLTEFADSWGARHLEPLAALALTPVVGTASLLDLLRAHPWNEESLDQAFDALAGLITREQSAAPPSVSELITSHGFQRRTRAAESAALNRALRRRPRGR